MLNQYRLVAQIAFSLFIICHNKIVIAHTSELNRVLRKKIGISLLTALPGNIT